MVNIEDDYSVFQNLGLMDFVIVISSASLRILTHSSCYCLRTEFRGYQVRCVIQSLAFLDLGRTGTLPFYRRDLYVVDRYYHPDYNPAPSKTPRFFAYQMRETTLRSAKKLLTRKTPCITDTSNKNRTTKKSFQALLPPKKIPGFQKQPTKIQKHRHFFHVKKKSAKKNPWEKSQGNKKQLFNQKSPFAPKRCLTSRQGRK